MSHVWFQTKREAFNKITQAVFNGSGGTFFLDAPGGTGKTFLINLPLEKKIKQRNIIALAMASGIAATLLTGGKTTQSSYPEIWKVWRHQPATLAVGLVKQSSCRSTDRLIVWDECTTSHKAAFRGS